MLEFIQTYWSYIATGLLFVLEVILFILKKRPEVVDNSFITLLTQWILEAEKRFKVGSEKMDFVLQQAAQYLGDKFNKKEVKTLVEYLLTLPEKKEK